MIAAALAPPSIWQWIGQYQGEILSDTGQHLELTVIAVSIGMAISLPLGMIAYRRARLYPPITWVTGVIYTIPSIALFVVMVPITGLSTLTVEIGLVSYTLLILIRNVVAGLRGVSEDVKEAARGMGYTPRQVLWHVELPIAVPTVVAGIRVATVSTIGLVTIGFIIGQGGLGELIIDGLDRFYTPEIIVGAVLSIALALVADGLLLVLGRQLTPWTQTSPRTGSLRWRMTGGGGGATGDDPLLI
jgi:osmoprotectant transport system permease protein